MDNTKFYDDHIEITLAEARYTVFKKYIKIIEEAPNGAYVYVEITEEHEPFKLFSNIDYNILKLKLGL